MKDIFTYIQNKSRYFVATFLVVIFMVVVGPAVYASFIQVYDPLFSSQSTGFGYGYGYGDSSYTYGYGYGYTYLPAPVYNGYGFEGTDGNVESVLSEATQTSFTVSYKSKYLSKHALYYSTDPLFNTYSNTSFTDFESGNDFSISTPTDLTCGTTYYFTIVALDAGNNDYHNFYSINTSDCSTTSSGNTTTLVAIANVNNNSSSQSSNSFCSLTDKFNPVTGKSCDSNQESKLPFLIDLKKGNRHPDVKRLQQFLNQNDYILAESGFGSPNNETTYFGNRTWNALVKYQIDHKITPSIGYFGPITREVINTFLGL